MKILVAMLSVGFAGTERHAVELADELSRQGHDVAMLLRCRPAEPHRHAAYDMLRSAVSSRIPVYLASRAAPLFALWHALIRFRPDVIHAHHERAVRITSRYSGRVPVVGTVHVHFRARDFTGCDGLVCLTEAEASAIPADFKGVVSVIGNWVRPYRRPDAIRLSALRSELGIAAGEYVIGTVARLEPVKGIADLIDAFNAARLPESRLVIVGEGSQRAELQRLAEALGCGRQVIFTGFRSDVRDLYFLFGVFVLNSVDEPYGLVILEAADAGLPVIAAASPGPASIADSLPITLVPARAPALLASALQTVYRRPAPAYDMSVFGVEAKTRATLAVYSQVIAARTARRHTDGAKR
jgi:glycosyltransferase involved in cell wall biosynthesis